MSQPSHDLPNVEKIARSVYLVVTARLAIVLCTVVGAPVATWMVNKVVNTIEKQGETLVETTTTLKLLKLQFDNTESAAKGEFMGLRVQLSDHEARLRDLERPPGLAPRARP